VSSHVVIGVGNQFRRDDGVGPAVLDLLRPAVPATVRLVASDGEPVRLIEEWAGADLALVIDALPPGAGGAAGQAYRLVVARDVAAAPPGTTSSHGLGLGEAIGLGRVLDRMPARLIVHAVQAAECGYGVGLTPAVAAAAAEVAAAVLAELAAAR
jgi:hydrogenase maturation protease